MDLTNPDALLYLGGLQMSQGHFAEAAATFQQLLQLRPAFVELYNDLGVAFAQQGKREEAAASFQRALALKSDYPEAHNNLGIVLAQQGQWDQAIIHYSEALRLRPDYAEAHNNLGIARARQGQLDEAITHYGEALRLRPEYAEAHNNLGLALVEQGNGDAALASYEQALRLQPNYAEAHYNRGLVLAKMEKLDEAIASYHEALRLRPDYAEAYNNLGVALGNKGQLEESVACLREALRLKPDYAEACYNAGLVLVSSGSLRVQEQKLKEAIACYQQALRIKPDYALAHKDLAMAWLRLGDFEQGWPEYEWRWQCPDVPNPTFAHPRWDGTPLAGRTILLHAEQGLGDTLQFIRYAPLVQQTGGKVLAICQPSLFHLLSRSPGIDDLLTTGSRLPDFDVQAPLLSLPGIFRTTLATIPAQVPYLFADPQLRDQWQMEMNRRPGFKIGIAWQGNPAHVQDRRRSLPLAGFEPLTRLERGELYSLQVGPGVDQLAHVGFPVIDLGSRFNPACFQDAAAAILALDLVITVDSAIAHLAGGMGIPVWVLLPYVPDWRWLLEREDSPWYPTMRLFRQAEREDWDGVIHRVVDAVIEQIAGTALI
ncbi:MAG TPA: tetratricopeptide repeat protein [Gemmataceae bacterium]|nr:tetratricopeptide repeat protein [Gemmataceae bacterium]